MEGGDLNIYKFPIQPLSRFNESRVKYKRPAEIMCYSHDENRKVHYMADCELVINNFFPIIIIFITYFTY
jgi:hypothetical protein